MIQTDTAKLGECEFLLISEIGAQLIVHHPYRALGELQTRLELTQEEFGLAWSIVNDHYVTDLPMRYPPHIIAAMAVIMTLTVRPSHRKTSSTGSEGQRILAGVNGGQAQAIQTKRERLKQWALHSDIDLDALADSTQHMICLYVLWDKYNEKECKDQVLRFTKDASIARVTN